MEIPTITAIVGILGSVAGASATVATAWVTQRSANKRRLLEAEINNRQALYGEFIGECARLLMDAFIRSLEKPETLLPLYALVNRIRLCASPAVLAEAERLLARIAEQYFSENLTVEEMRELVRDHEADPMMAFAAACRAEFQSMHAGF
jgi:hypothetical protein